MKNLLLALPLAALSLGFSSCCSMFGVSMPMYSKEKVRACCSNDSNARVEKLYVSYGKGVQPKTSAATTRVVKIPVSVNNGMGTRFSMGQHRLEEYRKTTTPVEVQETTTTTVAPSAPVYESRTVVTQQQTQVYDAKGGMSVAPVQQEVVQTKAVRYKTVKRIHYSGPCVRPYCPDKVCCGTTGPRTRQMASVQGSTGSPNLGLIPTMKPLAP